MNRRRTQLGFLSREAGRLVRSFGPYFLIELILPGGTLLAAALYLFRRLGCFSPR